MAQKTENLEPGSTAGSVKHILIMASDSLTLSGDFLACGNDPAYVRGQTN